MLLSSLALAKASTELLSRGAQTLARHLERSIQLQWRKKHDTQCGYVRQPIEKFSKNFAPHLPIRVFLRRGYSVRVEHVGAARAHHGPAAQTNFAFGASEGSGGPIVSAHIVGTSEDGRGGRIRQLSAAFELF